MQKMMLIIGLFWSGLLRHWFSQQLASNQTALSFCFRVRCFSSQRQPGWYRLLQRLLFYSFCIVCLTAMSYSSLFVVVWLSSAALISLIDWRLLILETQIFYTSLVFLVPLAYLSGWQLFWL